MRIDLDTPGSVHNLTELNFPKINGLNSTFMDTTTKMMTTETGMPDTADSFEKQFNETCHHQHQVRDALPITMN
jgi:hypothetical protein